MKFTEALKLLQRRPGPDATPFGVGLVCGFTSNHLEIFLAAHLRTLLPDRRVTVQAGLFGDFLGNLERAQQNSFDVLAVVLEWADLDPRLGLRQAGGWTLRNLADILTVVEVQATRFEEILTQAARRIPVALSLPTLPLPPAAFTAGWQLADFDSQLRARLASLAAHVVRQPGVRLVNPQQLDLHSPLAQRLDVKSDLLSGFPYRLEHASVLAELLARLLSPPVPKKGLITDLDDTLWRGLLGEVGANGIHWNLDGHSHLHALYQQLLQSLADAGILIGVASKNDPARVAEALRREDLLLKSGSVFPVEAGWGPKSESVSRILQTWNIAADSVVFVDDTPLELAEVQAAHPGIETLLFPKDQDQAGYEMLLRLRDLFGKETIHEEDRLRLDSLRRAAEVQQQGKTDPDSFLRGLEAELIVSTERDPVDPRALELVNKTNQFNLNGQRRTESEWLAALKQPEAFLFLVSYRDRFGPLGKIAVLAGRREGEEVLVDTWVMSCRAFSRRIEHKCLELLFEEFQTDEIVFDFEATPRNGPLQEFFRQLRGEAPEAELRLTKAQFVENCPPLFHQVEVTSHV